MLSGFRERRHGALWLPTATKARLLLMACLMKLGSLPVASDPARPTDAEFHATMAKLDEYQWLFDTH
jgi:L-asparaginase